MTVEIQLELNIEDKTPQEMKLFLLERTLSEFGDSMGKVRRKMFAEIGDVKKLCADLKEENRNLKRLLRQFAGQSDEWIYLQDGWLCDLKEAG